MRFSLIIAAHNEGPALWKTVASCVETCPGLDYEIVVADDASFDDSLVELRRRFPNVRIIAVDERQGASPTKDLGAREARGEVLVFLDGHCKPEDKSLLRLVEGVEQLQGQAIVTPAVAALDVERWRTSPRQIGHGYFVELEDLHCGWLPLSELQSVQEKRRRFYESPALIGCALAVSRELYDDLRGFDPHMRMWGVEDLDFGLKCWLMGHRILHDPEAVVGHRFRRSFDNFTVPLDQLAVNQLRMARKNFTDGVWSSWLTACRERNQGALPEHPEGLWARIWELFLESRESVEHERSYLLARRKHDEFWFAEKFGLSWPRLHGAGIAPPSGRETPSIGLRAASAAGMMASPSPSPSPPPQPPEPDPEPPCDDPNPDNCCDCGCSNGPVRYFNGDIRLDATDLKSAGFGAVWQHRRIYSNQLSSSADLGQGCNWLVDQWPYLVEQQDGSITVVRGTQGSLWFDQAGGGYVGRYGTKSTLTHDSANHRFVLTFPDGTRMEFHDFDQSDAPEGLFARQIEPGGAVTEVTAYTDDDLVAEIQRSGTVGSSTLTEAFVYTYSGAGRVLTATLRRQLSGGGWDNIQRAVYDYYDGSSSFGSEGDLERVRRQVPAGSGWADSETDYYRYWLDGDNHGFKHGLKFVVKPSTYVKLQAAGYDPRTASNATLSMFADYYYEYDDEDRVVLERIDAGSRTFTFSFTAGFTSSDFNVWAMKTVETLPDGNETIVYTNRIGQFLVKELRSGTQRWIDAWHYDAGARQVQHAHPSAVLGYDDTSPTLDIELRTADGLIELTEYYASSGSGAALGYVSAEKLKEGSSGTPVLLRTVEYASQSVGGATVYNVSKRTDYQNDNGTGAIETTVAYTFYSGTTQVQQATTTLPIVPTTQNGSGSAATRKEYFDTDGRLIWSMDERGFITNFSYDLATGAIVQQIDDVNTSTASGVPAGWTTPSGGGLNLVSDITVDSQGRMTQSLGPSHSIDLAGTATTIRRTTWMVYDDANHITYSGQGYATGTSPSYTYTLVNPVSITKMDAGGKVLEAIQATAPSTSGTLAAIITTAGGGAAGFPQTSYTRWTTNQYTDCCLAASQHVYHTIPASGEGSSGTNYDETDYGYDVMKRRCRTVTPGGTITYQVFDARGLVSSTWVGTNDTEATDQDPSGSGATGNNMAIVTGNVFDGGSAGGDGNLTQQTQYASSSDTRVTTFTFDFRDRRVTTDGEVDYFEKFYYDNLNRVIKTERYNTTSGGNLIARSETKFDPRGQVYQTIRYGVDPNSGTVGNSLTDNAWYDAAGNVMKSLPAGSDLFTKFVYDGLGRTTTQYIGYDTAETSYSDAGSVTDDVILDQSQTSYDAASNVLQMTSRQRYHNAPASQLGALGGPSTTPKARVTYGAQWPDPLGRPVAAANYGTNGGSSLSRPSTIPGRSDTVLVTSTVYDSAGNVQSATDPSQTVTWFAYDDAGRQITIIENYQGASSSSSSGGCSPSDDESRTTYITYTPDGAKATQVAENSRSSNQTTTYSYGTTLADSDIATSMLLRSVTFPDSAGSSDAVSFSYNRQGQRLTVTDQRGCIHSYDYDKLGRLLYDRVTTLGTGVDGAVRRLGATYEVRGMPVNLTSYDNSTAGSGSIVNQVQQAYNSFAQLVSSAQEHGGAVSGSSPTVGLSYANGSANTVRPTGMDYPSGRSQTYDYGTSGGISDHASRIASLIDNDGTTHMADYSFLGLGPIVVVDFTEPDVEYTLVDVSGSNDPDTGDIYSGLDRFGRVKDCRWYDYGSSTDVARLQYGNDRASNRLWRTDTVAQAAGKDFDELYSYDGLHRLQTMERGLLNGGHTAISSQTYGQCWNLDATGNWTGMMEADGGSTWTLQQSRTANPVNEITGITNTVGSAWAQPAYDPAGNMTTIPQPDDPTQSYTATYDAWNRLVKLVDGSDTVQENAYDARTFRTVRKDYTGGSLSETRHFYYDPGWRCVEERVGGSTDPNRQYVWGMRYIDDLVLRDRDTGGGSLNERLYGLQDANWNMVALINTAGAVQERYAYAPYGTPVFLSAAWATQTGSAVDNGCTFAGKTRDAATSLLYFRNRWLTSDVGSFLTRDPMGYVDGASLYQYVSSQPTCYTDSDGLKKSSSWDNYWKWWKNEHPGLTPEQYNWVEQQLARGCVGICTVEIGWDKNGFPGGSCYADLAAATKAYKDAMAKGCPCKSGTLSFYSIHLWNNGKPLPPRRPDPSGNDRVDLGDWYGGGTPGRPPGPWKPPGVDSGVNFDFGFWDPVRKCMLHADMYHNPDKDNDGVGDYYPKDPIREATFFCSSVAEWMKSNTDFDTEVWCLVCKSDSYRSN